MFPNFIADPYARAIFSSMSLTPTFPTHPLIGSFFPQAQTALAGTIPQGIAYVPVQSIHGAGTGSAAIAAAPQAIGFANPAAAQLAQWANAGAGFPQAWSAYGARSPFTAAYPQQFVAVGAGIPVQALI